MEEEFSQEVTPSIPSPVANESPVSKPENVAANVKRFGEAREELKERQAKLKKARMSLQSLENSQWKSKPHNRPYLGQRSTMRTPIKM